MLSSVVFEKSKSVIYVKRSCIPEVDDDVISGENVKCLVRYLVVNVEVLLALLRVVSEIFKNHFATVTAMEAATYIDCSIRRKRIRVSIEIHTSLYNTLQTFPF